MRRTTIALLAAGILAGGAVGCSKSYDDKVSDCAKALKEQAGGNTSKPAACKGVKDDDYTALVFSKTLDDNGWRDANGDPDVGKILEDATPTP
ncbi:hypothetical protein ACWC09_26425 [Streptomyces sp. NPDC001617]